MEGLETGMSSSASDETESLLIPEPYQSDDL